MVEMVEVVEMVFVELVNWGIGYQWFVKNQAAILPRLYSCWSAG